MGEDGYLVSGCHGTNREHIVCHSAAKLQGRSQVLQHLHVSRACRSNIDDARFAGKRFDAYRTVCSDAVFTAAVGCWIDGGRGSPVPSVPQSDSVVASGSIAVLPMIPICSASIDALSGPHHRGLCHVTVVIEAAVIAPNTDVVAPLPRSVRLVCNNAGEDHESLRLPPGSCCCQLPQHQYRRAMFCRCSGCIRSARNYKQFGFFLQKLSCCTSRYNRGFGAASSAAPCVIRVIHCVHRCGL